VNRDLSLVSFTATNPGRNSAIYFKVKIQKKKNNESILNVVSFILIASLIPFPVTSREFLYVKKSCLAIF